jgi:hypothetical protein
MKIAIHDNAAHDISISVADIDPAHGQSGKRGERSIVPGAFRRRPERPVRMHVKRKSGAEQQQTNRAGKWPGPASGPVDQIAEHEG